MYTNPSKRDPGNEEHAQAASELVDLLDGLSRTESDEARTTFIHELHGLHDLLRIMRKSDDGETSKQTARAVSALALGGVLVNEVVKVGAIEQLTTLLR
jgi:hypothetical protein